MQSDMKFISPRYEFYIIKLNKISRQIRENVLYKTACFFYSRGSWPLSSRSSCHVGAYRWLPLFLELSSGGGASRPRKVVHYLQLRVEQLPDYVPGTMHICFPSYLIYFFPSLFSLSFPLTFYRAHSEFSIDFSIIIPFRNIRNYARFT